MVVSRSFVVELTAETFDVYVEEDPEVTWLIEFYAPWCSHCKAFSPVYEEAANLLTDVSDKIVLAKVDATAETALRDRFKIRGYPSLRILRDGKDRKYMGPRNAQGLAGFMRSLAQPAVDPISYDEFFVETSKAPVSFVYVDKEMSSGTGTVNEESRYYRAFRSLARDHQGMQYFASSGDSAVAGQLDVDELDLPCVVQQCRKCSHDSICGKDILDEEKLYAFHKHNSLPLVSHFTRQSAPIIAEQKLPVVILMLNPKWELAEEFVDAMFPIAEEFKGKLAFTTMDVVEYEDHASHFGVTIPDDIPTVIVLDSENELYYPFYESQGSDAMYVMDANSQVYADLQEFFQAVQSGKARSVSTARWWSPTYWIHRLDEYLSELPSDTVWWISASLIFICITSVVVCCISLNEDPLSQGPGGSAALAGLQPRPRSAAAARAHLARRAEEDKKKEEAAKEDDKSQNKEASKSDVRKRKINKRKL